MRNPLIFVRILFAVLFVVLVSVSASGCSLVRHAKPDYLDVDAFDHLSHISAGFPFGPASDEDTNNQSGFRLGWRIQSETTPSRAPWQIELGAHYKWKGSGVYGPRASNTVRIFKHFELSH